MADPRPDPLARLRDLDDALARREPPPEAVERVRRALEARALQRPLRERLRWWPALAFAGGAALMGALLTQRPAPAERSAPATIAGRAGDAAASGDPGAPATIAGRAGDAAASGDPDAIAPVAAAGDADAVAGVDAPAAGAADAVATEGAQEGSCLALAGARVELRAGACLVHDGVRVDAIAATSLRWTDGAVAVIAGELLFDVDPRPGRPLRVRAGASAIEVVGTRFVVHHQGRSGWIALLEGHVRVRVGRGPRFDLRPGARMEWPGPDAAPAPAAAPTPPAADAADAAGDDGLGELLGEVRELRRRGDYAAAVDRLRAGARPGWSRRAQELVSYEIGALLERQLGDAAAACAHWQAHRRRFPGGRYEEILTRATARLECPRE